MISFLQPHCQLSGEKINWNDLVQVIQLQPGVTQGDLARWLDTLPDEKALLQDRQQDIQQVLEDIQARDAREGFLEVLPESQLWQAKVAVVQGWAAGLENTPLVSLPGVDEWQNWMGQGEHGFVVLQGAVEAVTGLLGCEHLHPLFELKMFIGYCQRIGVDVVSGDPERLQTHPGHKSWVDGARTYRGWDEEECPWLQPH